MCTVVVLRRPNHPWPLLLGANRDEMIDRPWRPPARHWPDRPNVIAGQDQLAGGSWLGVNDEGLVAAILNRMGTLGPEQGKRSRGELVLDALDHADAEDAARALSQLDPRAYRPFNMIIADNRDAFWLRADGQSVHLTALAEGLSMLTAFELNDRIDPRIANFLPRFKTARPPEPDQDDWQSWQQLLGCTASAQDQSEAGLCFQLENGFGTRSSALIALPGLETAGAPPILLFAAGPPDKCTYHALG